MKNYSHVESFLIRLFKKGLFCTRVHIYTGLGLNSFLISSSPFCSATCFLILCSELFSMKLYNKIFILVFSDLKVNMLFQDIA